MSTLKASDSPNLTIEWLTTGIEPLDYAIGKGIPFARITEISGNKGTAKTSLAFALIAAAQKQGFPCLYVDTERKASLMYAEERGVNLKKLDLIEAETGEEVVEELIEAMMKGKHRLIILDSIDGLVPRSILEGSVGQANIGAKSRLVAKLMRHAAILAQKHKIALVLINQVRQDVMTGITFTPGGKALEFYESVHVRLTHLGHIESGEDVNGISIKGAVSKNQVGMPFRQFKLSYLFKEGFSGEADLLDQAVRVGVIERKGPVVWMGERKLGIGIEKVRLMLKENPELLQEIKDKVAAV